MNEKKEPRPAAPIESFGAELFNALIQGSKDRFEIKDISYRDAVKFRHRCHMLRNRMREDNHPLIKVAARAKFRIEWDHSQVETLYNKKRVAYPKSPDAKVNLIIEPHDSEFREVLRLAGIDIHRRVDPTSGASAPMVASENPGGEPTPSLEKLLKDI